jgi:hypothetical protein
MRALLKEDLIVLIPKTADEANQVENWTSTHAAHVFCVRVTDSASLELHGLGVRPQACREPINIVSNSPDPIAKIISNFATSPFDLDGQRYQSVESYWQGLKFPKDSDRRRLAQLDGPRARAEGEKQGYGATVSYDGAEIAVGTWSHPAGQSSRRTPWRARLCLQPAIGRWSTSCAAIARPSQG